MRTSIVTVALLALMGGVAPALGEPEKPGRYSMSPTQDGFLRLDTVTGAVALCAQKDEKWSCEAVSDGTTEARQQIERLEKENKALKDDVARLEESLGLNLNPDDPSAPPTVIRPRPKIELPTEEDVDKAMDYVQRLFRKFRDKLKEFEKEQGQDGGGTPL